jgi:hypothetical protein
MNESRLGPKTLRVIIRNDAPMIFCNDSPSYRSVEIELTPAPGAYFVNQFGNPSTVDSLSAAPITFTFDIATNQLVLAPVPEPGTYAMLLAGLAAVGFMARRRKA